MENDPNQIGQHDLGAKLDLDKPSPLLCLSDFGPALRFLVGKTAVLGQLQSVEHHALAVILDQFMTDGIMVDTLLQALTVMQCDSAGQVDQLIRLDSLALIATTFPKAILDLSVLTAIGARKYRPSGWKSVPDGTNRYAEACARHLLKSATERIDADTGVTHWCCVAWNAAAVLTLRAAL